MNNAYTDNSRKDAGKGTGKRKIAAKLIAAAISLMLCFTGCAGAQAASEGADTASTQTTSVTYDAASKSEMFTERDLSGEYDEAAALKISLNGSSAEITEEGTETTSGDVSIDGSTITIKSEGTYILSGTLTDGMIIVEADDTAKVQIVLDGASITSSTSAALYVISADKVFVTTADGTENTLANGGTFTAIDDNNIDGAVFAKDDITFNGNGTLTVTSPAGHGIVGKDDVKIAGGTLNITASKHGVQANDSARFAEATVNITAGTDGVHVSDNSDAEEGTESDSYFYIADAALTIAAADDGIHSDYQALIEGGSITVTESYEGIEALDIEVSGGDIDVTASDDGFNAAGGNDTTTTESTFGEDDWAGGRGGFPGGGGFSDGGTDGVINISGGNIHIQAGGDGVDSNGSVAISGGTTVVEGPTQGDTSVLDYNGSATVTGGTFIGTGGAGMATSFSGAENQGLIAVSVGNQSAGTTVTLTDSDGNTVAEVTPELDYAVVYISTPDMDQNGTYTLTIGSSSDTITLTDGMYSTLGGGMGGQMGGSPRQGGMKDGQNQKGQMGGPGGSGMNRQGGPGGRDMQGNNTGTDTTTGATQMQQDTGSQA